MQYCIANKQKALEYGFMELTHISLNGKMVLNENELRLINEDIGEAAKAVQGDIMSYSEIKNYINESRQKK